MNTLVVYYSKFGNTKRVADAIAETCRSAGPVRIVRAEQLTAPDVNDVNLLVMGVPTHAANLPLEVRPILEDLPQRVLEGVKFAAFDTSYHMNRLVNLFTAAKRLHRKLRHLGGKAVVGPETFFVEGKEGPLEQGELERARTWTRRVLDRTNGR